VFGDIRIGCYMNLGYKGLDNMDSMVIGVRFKGYNGL
jgi:hypothetical protein